MAFCRRILQSRKYVQVNEDRERERSLIEIPERYEFIYSLVNNSDTSIENYVDEINVRKEYLQELDEGTNFSALLLSNQIATIDVKTV